MNDQSTNWGITPEYKCMNTAPTRAGRNNEPINTMKTTIALITLTMCMVSCYQEKPRTVRKPTVEEVVAKRKEDRKKYYLSPEEMEGKTLAEITVEARRRQKILHTPSTWQTNPEMFSMTRPAWEYHLKQGDSITKEGITVTVYGECVEVKKESDPKDELWNRILSGHGAGISADGIGVSYFTDWTLFTKLGTSEPISDANRASWPTE